MKEEDAGNSVDLKITFRVSGRQIVQLLNKLLAFVAFLLWVIGLV